MNCTGDILNRFELNVVCCVEPAPAALFGLPLLGLRVISVIGTIQIIIIGTIQITIIGTIQIITRPLLPEGSSLQVEILSVCT